MIRNSYILYRFNMVSIPVGNHVYPRVIPKSLSIPRFEV